MRQDVGRSHTTMKWNENMKEEAGNNEHTKKGAVPAFSVCDGAGPVAGSRGSGG